MSSCKVHKIFVRKLKIYYFVDKYSKNSSVLNFNETHRFGVEFIYAYRPTDNTGEMGTFL
jgi:hypothetical protein